MDVTRLITLPSVSRMKSYLYVKPLSVVCIIVRMLVCATSTVSGMALDVFVLLSDSAFALTVTITDAMMDAIKFIVFIIFMTSADFPFGERTPCRSLGVYCLLFFCCLSLSLEMSLFPFDTAKIWGIFFTTLDFLLCRVRLSNYFTYLCPNILRCVLSWWYTLWFFFKFMSFSVLVFVSSVVLSKFAHTKL